MMRQKKWKDVPKFGGTETLGKTVVHGQEHEIESIEAQSKTKLEDDTGYGGAAIIRRFTFGMNPEVFKKNPPTKQQLFNSHVKGIEVMLWRDGMKFMLEVEPRIVFNAKRKQYHIFVGAKPQKGHILKEVPQTLTQIANG